METYGRVKVACEEAVREGAGVDRSLICRAGLIVGPEDPTNRFPYWVQRLAAGGRVLAPGDPQDVVQVVDVRDLAAWLVAAGERGLAGTFDAASPPVTRGELLAGIAAGLGVEPELTWVDQEFLTRHEVRPWAGERSLPLWVPLPDFGGLLSHHVSGTLSAGLTLRPLPETASATHEWLVNVPESLRPSRSAPAGLTAEQEVGLLRAWDAERGR